MVIFDTVDPIVKVNAIKNKMRQMTKDTPGEFWEGARYILDFFEVELGNSTPAPAREANIAAYFNKQFLKDTLSVLEDSERAIKHYSDNHIKGKTWYYLCKNIQNQKLEIQKHL